MRHGISHGVGLVVGLFRSTNPIKEQPPSSNPPLPPTQLLKNNYDITMIEKVVECPWPMVGIYDGINK
jgi:hypothetical protein